MSLDGGEVGKAMDEGTVVKLISQFLDEHGFIQSLKSLERESGRAFQADLKTGKLQAILDEFTLKEKLQLQSATSVEHCFNPGNNEYADQLWCSFDGLCDGVNLLVVRLMENGGLLFGGAKSQLGVATLPLPLSSEAPPSTPIPTIHTIGKAGILCIDVHPKKRNLLLCGSMDRCAYTLDLEEDRIEVLQKFSHHTKYVVHAQWAPCGRFFVTGSYDHSLCVYRLCSEGENYELLQKLEMNGAVESLAFTRDSDEFVCGIRNSHLLQCYNLSAEKLLVKSRTINLNEFGDDFVSFTPMHISFSPDGQFFLVSTDRDRLILYSWKVGKQIASFYGATSDELSQPRHCWDSSGKYVYGTSQDFSICVWEIRNQKLVAHLQGHTATVRNLHFCEELGLLVSCGFDGTIKLWRRTS